MNAAAARRRCVPVFLLCAAFGSGAAARAQEVKPVKTAADARPGAPFVCTAVLGVAVTAEWFGAGFETLVDDGRWEAITKPHTTLADWGDPASPVWSLAPVSPCVARAGDPDRVILTGMNWEYTGGAQWVASLSAAVDVLKAKFPHLRKIELLTMVRAPGNHSCGNPMSVVAPFIDEAILTVTGRYPNLVRVGPQFEVERCDLFKKGGPHFTDEGSAAVARLIGAHYAQEAKDPQRDGQPAPQKPSRKARN
jgi:hypothetical protein